MDLFTPRLKLEMFAGHTKEADEANDLLEILEPQLGQEIGGTLTESGFVYGGYLDLFYSILKNKDSEEYKQNDLFKQWIQMTRGYREVNVVSDQDHNKVLYRVPPFYSSKIIDYSKLEPIWHLLDNVKTRFENDSNYLGANSKDRFLNVLLMGFRDAATEPNKETRLRWYNIFKRYMQDDGTFKIPEHVEAKKEEIKETKVNSNKKELRVVDDEEWE